MRDRIVLLLAGAACALGGVVVSGGIAGAQRATTASDAQVVRAIRENTQAVRALRGPGATVTLRDVHVELKRIVTATQKTCADHAQASGVATSACYDVGR